MKIITKKDPLFIFQKLKLASHDLKVRQMKSYKLGFIAAISLFTFSAHAQKLDSSAVGLNGLPAPINEVTVAESEEKKLLSGSTQKSTINPLMPALSGDASPPTVQSHVMESVNKQSKKPEAISK